MRFIRVLYNIQVSSILIYTLCFPLYNIKLYSFHIHKILINIFSVHNIMENF